VKNISVQTGQRSVGLRNVSFEIYGGEILGIAAVSGNGEKEIAEVMVRPSLLSRGEILVNGKSINGLSTAEVFMEGVFYTPEDRIKEGILNEGSINENVLLGHHTEKRFLRNKIFINWNEVRKATKRTIEDYSIYTPSGEFAIRRLSGGNIQKVIIGRALLGQISFLVTHNPTSGLDISSVEFIFRKLVDTRNSGGAVLWVGEDLDELMMISDRIAVLYNGELKAIFTRCEFDKYKIGLLMIGD
jgi:simple sugar transport system ATP-binding protein